MTTKDQFKKAEEIIVKYLSKKHRCPFNLPFHCTLSGPFTPEGEVHFRHRCANVLRKWELVFDMKKESIVSCQSKVYQLDKEPIDVFGYVMDTIYSLGQSYINKKEKKVNMSYIFKVIDWKLLREKIEEDVILKLELEGYNTEFGWDY